MLCFYAHFLQGATFLCALFATIGGNLIKEKLMETMRRQLEPAEQETLTLGFNEEGYVKSINFPVECCEPRQYLIQCEDEASSEGYLRMTFDDLDLPKGTFLQVHDGINMSDSAFFEQPYYWKGSWYRPVFASTGPSIFIKLTPRKKSPLSADHVGFKAKVWTSSTGPKSWTSDKPLTECPILGDTVDGGHASLSTITIYGTDTFRFDCVWQLRIPKGSSKNLKVFVRITDIQLMDAVLEIRDGLSSESTEILELKAVSGEDTMKSPVLTTATGQGYTSEKGFYIRVRKPVSHGLVNFTYGVFKETSKDDCSLKIQGKKIPGFKCESSNWCVPREYMCNGIPQCPDGSDEKEDTCQDFEVVTVSVPTTLLPPTTVATTTVKSTDADVGASTKSPCEVYPSLFKTCGDGSCVSNLDPCPTECGFLEKKCPDGSCVGKYYGTCPTEEVEIKCSFNEKKCDRMCIDKSKKCTYDICPAYKPRECDSRDQCYYESNHCNGYSECDDGSDELNCPGFVGSTNMPWFFWVGLIVVCLFVACCCKKLCNGKGCDQSESSIHTSDDSKTFWVIALLVMVPICCLFLIWKKCCKKTSSSRNAQTLVIRLDFGSSFWEKFTETWKFWFIAILIPLLCCCCGMYKYKRRKNRRRGHRTDEEGRADQLRPVTAGSQPMGSIDHYIDRGRNERSENDQLMNNSGTGNSTNQGFYSDYVPPSGPTPAMPPPAYHDAVDRTTYPPTLPQQQQQQPPRTDPQLPSYDQAMQS